MIQWLIRSQVYLAAGAGLLTAGSLVRLGGDPWRLTSAWVFLATLTFYNAARSAPVLPSEWVRLRLLPVVILGLVTGILTLWLLPGQQLVVVVLSVMALLYLVPIISRRAGSLRQAGLLKVPLVGVVWAGVTAGLPVIEVEPAGFEWIWLVAERAVFIAALTLPFELRDRRSDREAGLRTLAHVMRPSSLRRLGALMLMLSLLVSALSPVDRSGVGWAAVVLAHGLAIGLTLKATSRSHALFDVGLDGTILILAAGACIS
ncbi:MAG: UbiA family prenyltransferase [Phycisphaeraceae bacterium]